MNFKDKKKLFLILIAVAVVSTLISGFTPISVWDQRDYLLNEFDVENPDVSKTTKNSYILTQIIKKDYTSDFPSEYHSYTFFSFFKYETGDLLLSDKQLGASDYDVGNTGFFTQSIFTMIRLVSVLMGLIIFIYLVFLSVKNLGVKKINYFLYIAIGHIILLAVFLLGCYISYASLWGFDARSGSSIGYGFFVAVFSICLFLFLHFKQGLLLEDKDELTDIDKVES